MKKMILGVFFLALVSVGCSSTGLRDLDLHDFDGDGVMDTIDNCPALDNPFQENADGDLLGDVCDEDRTVPEGDLDGDHVTDSLDNCPALDNEDQLNWDGDLLGDVCDEDDDDDTVFDAVDNCRFVMNQDQANIDGDREGDLCDTIDSRACPDFIGAHECGGGWALCEPESLETVPTSHLIRVWEPTAATPAVYWYGADGRRYVLPNEATYRSWYPDTGECPVIRQISNSGLASIPLGGNVTMHPGVQMVKITTDPKAYVIERGGILHWVESEPVAVELYGGNWRVDIVDVPDSFFVNYTIGAPVRSAADYDPIAAYLSTPTIDYDLWLL
jgi:hypothetical protein